MFLRDNHGCSAETRFSGTMMHAEGIRREVLEVGAMAV